MAVPKKTFCKGHKTVYSFRFSAVDFMAAEWSDNVIHSINTHTHTHTHTHLLLTITFLKGDPQKANLFCMKQILFFKYN